MFFILNHRYYFNRQDPSAPEPFQALANLYEEKEDLEKGLQFALIAAQLAPPDPDEWSR